MRVPGPRDGTLFFFLFCACGEPAASGPSLPATGGNAGQTSAVSGGGSAGLGGSVTAPSGGVAGSLAGGGGVGGGGQAGASAGAAGTAGAGQSGGGAGGGGGAAACPDAGHAIEFDGDQHTEMNATIGNTLPLGNASRTVEMWLYTVPKSWRAEHHLYQYGGTNPKEGAFGVDFGDGPYPETQIYTNGTGDTLFKVPTDTVKETGWVHYAMVWDSPTKTLKGIINGVTLGKKTLGAELTTSLSPLSIGYSPTFSGGGGFTGKIDEVRVWSVARLDQDIQSTMHKHLTGKEANLVAYFTFDEGTGTSSKDLVQSYEANFGGKTAPKWATSDVMFTCP